MFLLAVAKYCLADWKFLEPTGFMVCAHHLRGDVMTWTKPEFTEVAVTLEVTAYAGRR
jgi:coenzyme PQQ precursor peptide PqqA